MEAPSKSSSLEIAALTPWETSMIEIFVRAANLIGLPRSIGEIYGFLFCSSQPQTFDHLVQRLGISRGSVSQGLKLLRQLGAVKLHYIAGSRKDHYVPELSMKRLVRGFVSDQFSPHIESGANRLDQIEALVANEADPALSAHIANRLGTLRSWQKRMQKLLPVILAVLGGTKFLEETDSPRDVI
jgi:DNA-binding transcriptional regulator GbsR (MarR family)